MKQNICTNETFITGFFMGDDGAIRKVSDYPTATFGYVEASEHHEAFCEVNILDDEAGADFAHVWWDSIESMAERIGLSVEETTKLMA